MSAGGGAIRLAAHGPWLAAILYMERRRPPVMDGLNLRPGFLGDIPGSGDGWGKRQSPRGTGKASAVWTFMVPLAVAA